MKTMIFGYVGPVSGLKSALDEFTKKQQEVVTVDEVQKYLTMIGCTDIPDEYIISVLNGCY